MRLISFLVLKHSEQNSFIMSNVDELGFIREHINFGSRTAVTRLKRGDRSVIEDAKEKDVKSFIEVDKNGVAVVVVYDSEYPEKVIIVVAKEILDEFYKVYNLSQVESVTSDQNMKVPALESMIKKYQDPKEADKLLKLQSQLEEVDSIMRRNLDDILKRGETLDGLMQKSKDVSSVSYNFYKKARETNKSCCSLY